MAIRPALSIGDVVKLSKSYWSVHHKSGRFNTDTTMIVVSLSKVDSSDGFCNVKCNIILQGGRKLVGCSVTFKRWELWKTGYNVGGNTPHTFAVPVQGEKLNKVVRVTNGTNNKSCVCATEVWMNLGCQCGAFQREMLAKAKNK